MNTYIVQTISVGGDIRETNLVQKLLKQWEARLQHEVFDFSRGGKIPPWTNRHICRVVFGNIAKFALPPMEGYTVREFFFPAIQKIVKDEETKQLAILTGNELRNYVEKTLEELPETVLHIPEVKKTLSRWKSEDLIALLKQDTTTTFKLLIRTDDVVQQKKTITIGEGDEADISLRELVLIRLASEVFNIESIKIERKGTDNARKDDSTGPNTTYY